MAFLKTLLFVLVSVGVSYSSFVDTLPKCAVGDKTCQVDLIKNIINKIGKDGAPEYRIPPIDPIKLEKAEIPLGDDSSNLVVKDIVVEGVKKCQINSLDINIDKKHVALQVTCDLHIEGNYEVKTISSSLLNNLLGGPITGAGKGTCDLEQLVINLQFPFNIVKRGDDVFLTSKTKKYTYTYKIHKSAKFSAEKILLGGKDETERMLKIMNENWETIIDAFGKKVVEFGLNIVRKFLLRFVENVPTKYYLIDDISSLAE